MRRTGLCLVTLLLVAVPLLAQSSPAAPACGAMASFAIKGFEGTFQPLAPEERLFFGLSGLEQEKPLEVRYSVEGKPYLTEVVDLATSRLPQVDAGKQVGADRKVPFDLKTALEEERMIELLALRPDLVRQLHQRAGKNDASIKIEVHQKGRLVESLSFEDLKQRGADLNSRQAVPLVVRSKVSGPGNRGGGDTMKSVVAFDYLESCGDCTSEMPCDTECGWDPGKGGPVTCGEQGQPCDDNSTCSCSTVYQEVWGPWYVYNAYYSNQYACYEDEHEFSYWYRAYIQQTRRDRIRRTFVCPNCPACTGCYTQEDVIDYQLSSTGCWSNTYSFCSWGDPLCCSVPTCSYNSSCHWHC